MCAGPEILAIAGLAKGVGGFAEASDAAGQYEDRADQILSSAKESMRQGAKARERRRGAQRVAFAKGGVKMTGTPKRLLEEQIKQDEMELLKQKYNAELELEDTSKRATEVRKGGLSSLISGGIQAYGGFSG